MSLNIKPTMRTTLSIISMFLMIGMHSQNEYFLNDTRWNVTHYCEPIFDSYTDYYHVLGDTILNDVPYKIISGNLNEIVRSEGTVVYRWNQNTNEDDLMYDFHGEVGDTLDVNPFFLGNYELVITDIDSVMINSQWKKVYYVVGSNGQWPMAPVLIEGVGSAMTGLFGAIDSWFDCSIMVTCYSVNDLSYHWNYDQTIFVDFEESPGECLLADDISEISGSQISFFPNPCSRILTVKSDIHPDVITIMDAMGKVFYQQLKPGAVCEIDVSALAEGIYFFEVTTGTHSTRHRFLKVE